MSPVVEHRRWQQGSYGKVRLQVWKYSQKCSLLVPWEWKILVRYMSFGKVLRYSERCGGCFVDRAIPPYSGSSTEYFSQI
jgi:hypothetical protein